MAGEFAICIDRHNGEGKHENADVSCGATSYEMDREKALLLRVRTPYRLRNTDAR